MQSSGEDAGGDGVITCMSGREQEEAAEMSSAEEEDGVGTACATARHSGLNGIVEFECPDHRAPPRMRGQARCRQRLLARCDDPRA
eukprot:5323054-Pyramimonas_sp.AAC.2